MCGVAQDLGLNNALEPVERGTGTESLDRFAPAELVAQTDPARPADMKRRCVIQVLVQQGVGTRPGRSAPLARPIRNPPLLLRSACGSYRPRGLRVIASGLCACQDGVLRRQARAAAP